MKPLKFAETFSSWLLRLSFATYLVVVNINNLQTFTLANIGFYSALALIVLAVMLVVGGFMSNQSFTVISSLGIVLIFIIKIFAVWPQVFSVKLMLQIVFIAIALSFASRGK